MRNTEEPAGHWARTARDDDGAAGAWGAGGWAADSGGRWAADAGGGAGPAGEGGEWAADAGGGWTAGEGGGWTANTGTGADAARRTDSWILVCGGIAAAAAFAAAFVASGGTASHPATPANAVPAAISRSCLSPSPHSSPSP